MAARHQLRGRRAARWRFGSAFSRAASRFFRNFFATFAGEDAASSSASRTASRKRRNVPNSRIKTHIARYCESFTGGPLRLFSQCYTDRPNMRNFDALLNHPYE